MIVSSDTERFISKRIVLLNKKCCAFGPSSVHISTSAFWETLKRKYENINWSFTVLIFE